MGKDRGEAYSTKKGRKPTSRFARLDHQLLCSSAYRSLSPNARALLVELTMMENGKNNGVGLYLSARDAADRMGIADPNTACRAFDELIEMGFIAVTADSHFAVKAGSGSRARYWRLTWQAVASKQGPTNEFEKAEPRPGTAARKRMDRGMKALKRWQKEQSGGSSEEKNAVCDFPTHEGLSVGKSHTEAPPPWEEAPSTVCDFPTQNQENGEKPPNPSIGKSHTYTAIQADSAEAPSLDAAIVPAIHSQVAGFWAALDPGAREQLAAKHGLTIHELRQYVEGRLALNIGKQMALRSAAKEAA